MLAASEFIFEDKDGTHVLIVPEDYYPEFLGHDEWGSGYGTPKG